MRNRTDFCTWTIPFLVRKNKDQRHAWEWLKCSAPSGNCYEAAERHASKLRAEGFDVAGYDASQRMPSLNLNYTLTDYSAVAGESA